MSFWTWLTGTDARAHSDTAAGDLITPNDNPAPATPPTVGVPDYTPGDPDGFELTGDPIEYRALPTIVASPWDGWPLGWDTPLWQGTTGTLVDTAWTCIDLNASILASMPVYKLRGGQIVEPETWMTNPDPRIYTSWQEFAKQLFWEYHLGEAFVLATDYFSSGWPMFFRVIPASMVKVEMVGLERRYLIGQIDVTESMLHIRYQSRIDQPRGVGPLEAAGARVTAAAVMARYSADIVRNGGINVQTLETDADLPEGAAQAISDQWVDLRRQNLARPPVLDNGIRLVDHQISTKDAALLEIANYTDARICVLLGVPPFLKAIATGESMTYSNVSQVFDFHDRSHLRPTAAAVMSALSEWALPRGSTVELNRDEYSRPPLLERATAYEKLVGIGALDAADIQMMERWFAIAGISAPAALTGGQP